MRIPPLAFALALCSGRVSAAESAGPAVAPPPSTSEQRPAIFAPRPATTAPPRPLPGRRPTLPPSGGPSRRAISPELAANLTAVAMRAAPPVAAKAPPATAPPANGETSDALLLDPFVVEEDKTPKLDARRLLTPKEMLELAHRLNPGLKLGRAPLGNDALALDMLEEELAKQRRAELRELNSVLTVGGQKAPPEVQRKIDEALLRQNGWLDQKPGTRYREPR